MKWCRGHFINHRALTRAVAVRRQLVRYLQRSAAVSRGPPPPQAQRRHRGCHSARTAYPQRRVRLRDIPGMRRHARFNVPLVSCGRDQAVVRRCLVAGYFAQAARLHVDGASYRTVRDAVVTQTSRAARRGGSPRPPRD